MEQKKAAVLASALLAAIQETGPFMELVKAASRYQEALASCATAAHQFSEAFGDLQATCGASSSIAALMVKISEVLPSQENLFTYASSALGNAVTDIRSHVETDKQTAASLDRQYRRDEEKCDRAVMAAAKAVTRAKDDQRAQAKREFEAATREEEATRVTHLNEALKLWRNKFSGISSGVLDLMAVFAESGDTLAQTRKKIGLLSSEAANLSRPLPLEESKLVEVAEPLLPGQSGRTTKGTQSAVRRDSSPLTQEHQIRATDSEAAGRRVGSAPVNLKQPIAEGNSAKQTEPVQYFRRPCPEKPSIRGGSFAASQPITSPVESGIPRCSSDAEQKQIDITRSKSPLASHSRRNALPNLSTVAQQVSSLSGSTIMVGKMQRSESAPGDIFEDEKAESIDSCSFSGINATQAALSSVFGRGST